MKKNLLKYLLFTITAAFMLTGCMEEKDVMPPIPYIPEKPTEIDMNNKSTLEGSYSFAKFTQEPKKNIVGINALAGGLLISYDKVNQKIEYQYIFRYGGYNNTSADLKLLSEKNILNENDFTVNDDKYTITFNIPITYNADGVTYTINSITKTDDALTIIEENLNLDYFIGQTTKLCDPSLPINDDDDKTCGLNGAPRYVGYYRIDNITCGNINYIGGKDFAGEMTASADTSQINISRVTVPINMKFQVYDNELKQCILNQEQITNNNFFFQNIDYVIELGSGALPNFAAIFSDVGLIGITSGSEKERVSYIYYEPKNQDYSDMLFNGNKVQLKLRIMQQGIGNSNPFLSPVTLDNTKYF